MSEDKADKNRLWKGTTGGGDFAQRSLVFFIRLFGLRFMYVMMSFSIPFFVFFHRKETRAIVKYYREIHHLSKFPAFLKTFTNNCLFGKVMLDRIALMAGCRKSLVIDIPDEDLFLSLAEKPGGFILGSSHVGNFELAGYALHQEKKKIHSVVFGGEDPKLQKRRDLMLERNNIACISVTDGISHIFHIKNALDNGDIVSMPCDRVIGDAKTVTVSLCGREARLPLGPFLLAVKFRTSLLSLFIMREKTWHYSAYVKEIDCAELQGTDERKIAEVANLFAAELEQVIYKYPDQWFNFFDFWK